MYLLVLVMTIFPFCSVDKKKRSYVSKALSLEQLRKTTDTAPDEETNKKLKRQRRSAQDRQRGTDRDISRVRQERGRTLHYGAGSGVVGPHEADSEGSQRLQDARHSIASAFSSF